MTVKSRTKYHPHYVGPICLEQIGTAEGWPEGQNTGRIL
ncbi:MAG: hypothetical protein ACI965_000333 [Paraglaciecola sp.]|jgi:hypothetical protein